MADLRTTAINPNAPIRRDQLPQMTATPRSPRLGMLADALMAARNFANRVQVPQAVPLIGGEGLGSLVLGRAPEELVEMSYGNMPMRVNPYAGRTASFVPEMKPNRGAQVADLLSLAGVPGGGRTAAAMVGGGMADFGAGAERALIGYHGTPHRFAPTPANPMGEFRASQIGTGEGAQAYGYGLYFAESPGVAKGYRASVSATPGMQFGLPDGPVKGIATLIAARGDEGERMARKVYANSVPDIDAAVIQAKDAVSNASSLYTVDIPDEMIGKMLDYDKPLSRQSAELQSKLKSVVDTEVGPGVWESWIKSEPDFRNLKDDLLENKTDAEVSALLREAGIPGVRYLDRQSRPTNIMDKRLQGLFEKHNGDIEKTVNEYMRSIYDTPKVKEKIRADVMKQLEVPITRNIVVFPGEEQNVKILSRE